MPDENPFEPDETPEQQDRRIGRMIRENAGKRMLVAAPLEGTLTPEEYLKEWDTFNEVELDRPFSYWMQFARAYAAVVSKNLREEGTRRPHLVYEAKQALLRKSREWDDEDWTSAPRFERHAVNAVLDLVAAEARISELEQQLAAFKK